ncbi:heterokaryon incompatibility protein-domain-containing protein [Hyaloscypha finlandica]|nr:heterokaryon incompatibility protein-domain-containing protein [Hyaloscypha finlandica]
MDDIDDLQSRDGPVSILDQGSSPQPPKHPLEAWLEGWLEEWQWELALRSVPTSRDHNPAVHDDFLWRFIIKSSVLTQALRYLGLDLAKAVELIVSNLRYLTGFAPRQQVRIWEQARVTVTTKPPPPGGLYRYQQLLRSDSIRVVELLSMKESRGVKLFLHETNLLDAPAFQTLSYEWGASKRTYPVACGKGHILVTTNLLAALKKLRLPTLRRFLWIDALCIDQENDNERTQQVSIMGKIYKAGDKVLIWLGDSVLGSQEALTKLDQIGQVRGAAEADLHIVLSELYERARKAKSGIENPRLDNHISECEEELVTVRKEKSAALQDLKVVNMDLFDVGNVALWQAIIDLLSRTYWNRLWIVQEVTVSHRGRVICGPYSSDWDHFYKAARHIHDLNIIKDPPLTLGRILTISDRRGYLWYKEQLHYELLIDSITSGDTSHYIPHIEDLRGADRIQTTSLKFLLEQFSDSQATDPRDRVFALLSLVDAKGRDQLQADYGLTEAQVYHKTMSYVLSQERGADLLEYFAAPSLSHIQGTPSWVPDFRCPRLWTAEVIESVIEDPIFINEPPIVGGESLLISGIVHGKIKACTICMSPAEAYHFRRPESIVTQDIKILSDLVPPDMSDFILAIEDVYADSWKSHKSVEVGQEQDMEFLTRKTPQEDAFWDVLTSPNGQTALKTNGMPHEYVLGKVGEPMSSSAQRMVDIYGLDTDAYIHEVENCLRIQSGVRDMWLFDYLNKRGVDYNTLFSHWAAENCPLKGSMALCKDNRAELYAAIYSWAHQEWNTSIYLHKHGRQLFMMGQNTLGLGPPGLRGIKEGDLVVRLDGGRQLCALSRQPNGSYSFRGVVTLEDGWYAKHRYRPPERRQRFRIQ